MTTEQALRKCLDLLARLAEAPGAALPADFDKIYDAGRAALNGRCGG